MNTIKIFGGDGQHASDLIKRGIFNNFSLDIAEKDNDIKNNTGDKAFITPISKTKAIIEKVTSNNQPGCIINFSGIMNTTPKNIRKASSNFHFLFGPKAKNGLKLAVTGNIGGNITKILDNVKKAHISIIETDIETHDNLVATTQALTHLIILLSGVSHNKRLIKEWSTPNMTIRDMIFYNPKFIQQLKQIKSDISIGGNLSEVFLDRVQKLSQSEVDIFGTPTFFRVENFCKNNTLSISKNMLEIMNKVEVGNEDEILQLISRIKSGIPEINTLS